ncbi:hypothetical protein T12_11209 [Trichinella patagoniensis]|uniref:Peptidase S1 domain-containing protein n=1 Tax=Trichinella patagoniensis TaxID=990121 RepID=A0A0V1A1M9_9BILA|nr:hypothetical protein T12_11209 [Trichinella patagoniensis]
MHSSIFFIYFSSIVMAWKIFAPVHHQYSFVIGRDMSKECGKSVVQDFLNSSDNQTILPEEYMPWSIEVKGYCQGKKFGYQRITCQSFLVISNKENAHSDVILTTASCLFKETNCIRFHVFNPVNNETVNVAFFTTMAKSFKGMDHDIALLFLQSPIQFSRRTWPICFSSMINSMADFMDDCIFIRRVLWESEILFKFTGDGEAVMCRKDRRWFLKSVGGTSLSADKSMVKVILCKHVVINYIPIDYQFKITNIVARINDQSKTSIDQQRRLLIFWLSEADSHVCCIILDSINVSIRSVSSDYCCTLCCCEYYVSVKQTFCCTFISIYFQKMQKLELALKHLHKRIELLADGKNSAIRMHEFGAYRILLLCFLERNHFNDFSSLIFYHLGRLLKIPASCNPFKPDLSSEMHHADSILKGYSKELDNELSEEGYMTDNIFVSDKCRNALLHQAEHLRDCLHTNMKMNSSFSDEVQLDEKNAHLLCIISGIASSFQELSNEKNGITATVSDVTANSDSVASSNDLRKSGGKRKTAQHAEGEPSCLERKRAKILNLKQPVKNKRAADNLDHQNASDNAKSLKITKYAIMTRKQNREIGQSAQKSSSKGNSSSENEKNKITVVPRKNVTLEMKKKKCRKKRAGKSRSSNKKAIPTSAKPLSTEVLEVGKSDSAISPFEDISDNSRVTENESRASECIVSPDLLPSNTDSALQNELPENLEQPPLPCNVVSSANCEISQQSEYSESIIQKDKNSVLLSTESPQNTDSSNTVLESTMEFETVLENGSVSKESEKLDIENEQASVPETLPSIDAQSEPAPLQHSTSIVECLTSGAASSSMINEANSEPVAAVQPLVGSLGSSSFSTLEIIDLTSCSESASASDSEKKIVIDLTGDDEEYICSNALFTNAVNETNKETSKMNTDENEPKEVETLLPSPKAVAVCDRNEFASTVNGNSSDVNGDLRTEVNISDKEQNALGISSEAVLVEKVQVSAEEVTDHAKGGGNAVLKTSGNQPLLFKKVALLKTAMPKIGPDGKPLIIRSYRLLTSKSSVGCDKLKKNAECSATNIRKNVMIIKKSRVCEGNGKLLLLRQNVQMDGEKRNFNANGLRPLATLRDLKRDQLRLSLLMAKFNKVGRANFENDALSASNNSLSSTLKLNSTNNGFCESSRAAPTIHNEKVDKAAKNVQVLTYVIDDAGKKHYRIQSRPSSVQVVPNEASSSGAAVLDSSK